MISNEKVAFMKKATRHDLPLDGQQNMRHIPHRLAILSATIGRAELGLGVAGYELNLPFSTSAGSRLSPPVSQLCHLDRSRGENLVH